MHWFLDHAETISPRNIDRVKALGGGIAVQHRMAYQGEDFAKRYGKEMTAEAPPDQAHPGRGRPARRRNRRHTRGELQPLGLAVVAGDRQDASAARRSTRRRTASTARRRCGCGPRRIPGSPTRKARKAPSRPASSPISRCCPRDYMTRAGGADQGHHLGADRRGRQRRLRRRFLRQARAAAAAGQPRLVAGQQVRRLLQAQQEIRRAERSDRCSGWRRDVRGAR